MQDHTSKTDTHQSRQESTIAAYSPDFDVAKMVNHNLPLTPNHVIKLQQTLGNTIVQRLIAQRDEDEESTESGFGQAVTDTWNALFGSQPTEEEVAEAQPDDDSPVRRFPDVTGRCITPAYAESLDTSEIQERMDVLREEMNRIGTDDPLYRAHSANIYILENEFAKRGQTAASELTDDELTSQIESLTTRMESMDTGDPTYQSTVANLNVLRAELANRGRTEELNRLFEDVSSASNQAEHRQNSEAVVDYVRQQIEIYPDMLRSFVGQPQPSVEEKQRIIGRITAAVARTEFLLGRIYYQGSDDWEETNNSGYMVDSYTGGNAGAWCTRFATTVLSDVVGSNSVIAGSGYKAANPEDFNRDLDYSEEFGGTFVGTTSAYDASPNERSRQYNIWAAFHRDLENAPEEAPDDAPEGSVQTRADVAREFMSQNIQPQAGDIMIVTRSSSDGNSFSGERENGEWTEDYGLSHTTMIERVDGFLIYTIEGNTGSHGEVAGRVYDLTDPDDVERIVYIARPSLASGRDDTEVQTDMGAEASPDIYTESDLMTPVNHINELLERFAADSDWIETPGEGEQDVVANMD